MHSQTSSHRATKNILLVQLYSSILQCKQECVLWPRMGYDYQRVSEPKEPIPGFSTALTPYRILTAGFTLEPPPRYSRDLAVALECMGGRLEGRTSSEGRSSPEFPIVPTEDSSNSSKIEILRACCFPAFPSGQSKARTACSSQLCDPTQPSNIRSRSEDNRKDTNVRSVRPALTSHCLSFRTASHFHSATAATLTISTPHRRCYTKVVDGCSSPS